jgi:hypothetical protein
VVRPSPWNVWLNGDHYADLTLEAIREREHMALLEREPRYGDNEARPAEPTRTAGAAQNDPPLRPSDRPTPAEHLARNHANRDVIRQALVSQRL